MLWYRFSCTVPANRPINNPYSRPIQVPEGIIHKFRMRYPAGPNYWVSTGVFLGTAKIFPCEPSEWFVGENEYVEGEVHVVTKKGWHWTIQGYSPGSYFPHTVYLDLFILPEEKASPWMILSDFVKIMKRLMGLP